MGSDGEGAVGPRRSARAGGAGPDACAIDCPRALDPGAPSTYFSVTMIFRKKPRPEAPIVHVADDDFEAVVAGHAGVTVVDFWAVWCPPCRMMEPILEEIALEFEPHDVLVLKVDVDRAPETAESYGIRSVPTLVFFRGGEPLFEMVGAVPKPVLQREIHALLRGDPGLPQDAPD